MGWSTILSVYDYRYLAQSSSYWEKSWDIFLFWLELIWIMYKRRIPYDVLKCTEWSFLQYIRGINEAHIRLSLKGEVILSLLHSMGQLLWEMCESAYEEQREEL